MNLFLQLCFCTIVTTFPNGSTGSRCVLDIYPSRNGCYGPVSDGCSADTIGGYKLPDKVEDSESWSFSCQVWQDRVTPGYQNIAGEATPYPYYHHESTHHSDSTNTLTTVTEVTQQVDSTRQEVPNVTKDTTIIGTTGEETISESTSSSAVDMFSHSDSTNTLTTVTEVTQQVDSTRQEVPNVTKDTTIIGTTGEETTSASTSSSAVDRFSHSDSTNTLTTVKEVTQQVDSTRQEVPNVTKDTTIIGTTGEETTSASTSSSAVDRFSHSDSTNTLTTVKEVTQQVDSTRQEVPNVTKDTTIIGTTGEETTSASTSSLAVDRFSSKTYGDISTSHTSTDPYYSSTAESDVECMTFLGAEDDVPYRIFHAAAFNGFIEFDVRAQKDVDIVLLSSFANVNPYQIIIGGWDNTKSAITSCAGCPPEVLSAPAEFLNETSFTHFWINITSNGTILVGKGFDKEPFMQWTNPNHIDVKYIGYRVEGNADGGEFRFCHLENLEAQCPSNLTNYNCSCKLSGGHSVHYLNAGFVDCVNICHCDATNTNSGRCLWLPSDCHELHSKGISEDGVYSIYPSRGGMFPMDVLCNMTHADGGWTVIQRRVNGTVDFDKNSAAYKERFGILSHELWIGNSPLYSLLQQANYKLRIDLVLLGDVHEFAEYDSFNIEDEVDDFRISSLGKFFGSNTLFNAMALHLNMKFTTYDHDVDQSSNNCAGLGGGGWWYNGGPPSFWCWHANLNGQFGQLGDKGISWYRGYSNEYKYLLKYVDMKIRPQD